MVRLIPHFVGLSGWELFGSFERGLGPCFFGSVVFDFCSFASTLIACGCLLVVGWTVDENVSVFGSS